MNDFLLCPSIDFPAFLDPVIIRLGPIALHWYGLGYVIGILFAWWYAQKLLDKSFLWNACTPPTDRNKISDFIVWATLGVIIGGRLGQVLIWDFAYYFEHPSAIIAVWDGGMSFHGGLVGTIIAMFLFARKNSINLWTMFDITAAGVPVGIGIVRICNFINQELWGNVTTVSWAVCFSRDPQYLPRHPSQLYEALIEGFFLFIVLYLIIFLFKALKYSGIVAGTFLVGYGLARTVTEAFRAPQEDPAWFSTLFHATGLTYGMVLSFPMILFGSYILLQATRNHLVR
ncbi:prolipoprotein diacylglyceryl transferase [Bartonella ancashensis]|uniref:Phosphatidylglycerol--prolipoprotein diacylglyceryl transferase n=1 Tax=Bartonella ancashensis TaxID=1318743 RepID=A0A0M4M605_9HYPH|nr:prolipoprotein diacylglyceryl transferase [Bartonella ancashensis]ALE03579.1 Prolipoprotein diacylglyceryl transferase [Bartonella ancashensis]